MLLFKSYVSSSSIEGVGVFAAEKIVKGAEIWRANALLDVLIPETEISNLDPVVSEFVLRYGYPSNSSPGHIVVEADNGRFMNHSDDPNTDFTAAGVGIALRDIEQGEEVTCNYAEFFVNFELMPSIAA